MQRDVMVEFLKRVYGAYPAFRINDAATINAWIENFKSVSVEQLDEALKKYINNGKVFAPNIADLKKLIPKITEDKYTRRYLREDQSGFYLHTYYGDGKEQKIPVWQESFCDDSYVDSNGYVYAVPER